MTKCVCIRARPSVCSEQSLSNFFCVCVCVSGVGGQIDFMRGAALGADGLGKPIMAMPSSTKKGESKIVPILKQGFTRFHFASEALVPNLGINYPRWVMGPFDLGNGLFFFLY